MAQGMNHLVDPVVVLGPARSGTTIVAEILASHPALAYWPEPKYIWRYGGARDNSDVRDAHAASPDVRTYIRAKFSNYVVRQGGKHLLEKTPSNVFRIPFIREVLGKARVVVVLRGGEAVVKSAIRRWTGSTDWPAVLRRARYADFPGKELPYYLIRNALGLLRPRTRSWGPVFPGMNEMLRNAASVEEVCVFQWLRSIEYIARDLPCWTEADIVTVDYENLVKRPGPEMQRVAQSIGLESSAIVAAAEREVNDRKVAQDETETDLPLDLRELIREGEARFEYIRSMTRRS